MENILIVCTGNTCRSPMAEGILKSVLDRAGKREQYNVYSRGAAAFDGDAASENALLACAEYGVDISAHRSKRLTVYDVERADKIFVMTEGIKNAIISAVPSAAKKSKRFRSAIHSGRVLTFIKNAPKRLQKFLRSVLQNDR